MKHSTIVLSVVLISLSVSTVSSYGAGFVWEPTRSTYGAAESPFYALNPMAAAAVGLGTGEGYGTVASNGIGIPGTTAYGGVAPANLAAQEINERPGHYYFGFANTYPTTNNFSAYELGNTVIQPETTLSLIFRRTTNDPINFIGICGGTDPGDVVTYQAYQQNAVWYFLV